MARRGGFDEAGVSPVLSSLYLLASAFVLAGGFYVARSYYIQDHGDLPDVGTWGDDSHDRILIVQGDDIEWSGLELQTDRPARAALEGEVSLQDGVLSPGGHFVPLGATDGFVEGGDALSICGVAKAGPVKVTLRDAATQTVLFEQVMDVKACPVGDVGQAAAAGGGRRSV